MEKGTILKLNKAFEEYAYKQEDVEYWLARELQELLGFTDWRNILNTVDKARESYKTTGEEVSDHFVDVNKMIELGKGGQRTEYNDSPPYLSMSRRDNIFIATTIT